ncbi:MAG: DUF3108 domain-containing protein [Myxococcales bacterium]|nr:DUF3108 domain-containing protein [Myxococcales bacterium]
MKCGWRIALLPLIALLAWAAGSPAADFGTERLVYEFGWQNISAATATIAIDPATVAGVPGYKAVVQIQGKPKLDWIWRVRDKISVETTADKLACQRFFFEQREASFFLDTEIRRDPTANLLIGSRTRIIKNTRKALSPKDAPLDHYDPLSAILFLRRSPLSIGQQYNLKAFDGKRRHDLTYRVIGEERIKIGLGEFDTWKVQPRILRSTGNVQGSDVEKVRQLFLWVDKNPPHHVLRLESEAFVGHIYGELVQKN